jgi:DNA-binding NarL/FixJ family response regulator
MIQMVTKCLVVDDHKLVAASLILTLQNEFPELEISHVGTVRDAIDFIGQYEGESTCLILLDMVLPDQNGIAVLAHLRKLKQLAKFPCIVMSGMANPGNINLCKKEGAYGFISKSDEAVIFVEAVRNVLSGRPYFPISEERPEKNFLEKSMRLTPRQRKTLDLVVQGCMNKVIADELAVNQKSAENYVCELLTLFSVNTRTELVRDALNCGYVIGHKKT